jgi:FAD/FMN-containing dehydrogenase
MATLDYAVQDTLHVSDAAELADALRSQRGPVRLLGSGSAQPRLPPPPAPPTLVSCARMNRIDRLEPDDLTCSVEPGLPRAELDAALAERGVWLPCAGTGTVGGMFAADLAGPLGPGGIAARSLLLGLEGVLAEGLHFKCGARVVKSVAGFDVPKLFVGSRGALFAATLLHLKVRPRPPAIAAFARSSLAPEEALVLYHALRVAHHPPHELWLARTSIGAAVRGCFAGNARWVADALRAFDLPPADDAGPRTLGVAAPGDEIVQGQVPPSRAAELLAAVPSAATILLGGAGQFEVRLAATATDALLARCAELGAVAMVRSGPPQRRGHGTASDPAATRLAARIKSALDPHGVLV